MHVLFLACYFPLFVSRNCLRGVVQVRLLDGHLDFSERYTKTQEGGELGGSGLFI